MRGDFFMRLVLFVAVISALSFGCNKFKKQAEEDDKAIQEYLTSKNLTATKMSSGLYVIIDEPGTGASCTTSSSVKVKYKGYLLTDVVFDSSATAGATFNLKNVIEGWRIGIPHFKEGGKGKLLIPSALGYGRAGSTSGSIPPNSPLVFDIELLEVY